MTRLSKQGERRRQSPRKRKAPSIKTGPKKDKLSLGYKPHENAVQHSTVFIGKVRTCHVSS